MQADHARNDSPATWRRWLPRFSLRELLLAMTFAAVGCYALRWASPWWSMATNYASGVLIVVGFLVAIYWQGPSRSFWLGFAICALAHVSLNSDVFQDIRHRQFVTDRVSTWTYDQIQSELVVVPIVVTLDEIVTHQGTSVQSQDVNSSGQVFHNIETACEDGYFRSTRPKPMQVIRGDFVRVAQGLWTLVWGYIGGHISLVLYRGRGRTDGVSGGRRGRQQIQKSGGGKRFPLHHFYGR